MAHPGGDGTWPPPDSSGSGHDHSGQLRPEDQIGRGQQGRDHPGRRRSATVVRFVVLMALAGVVTFGLFALYFDGQLGADPSSALGKRTQPCAPAKFIASPNNTDATPASTGPPTVTPSQTTASQSTSSDSLATNSAVPTDTSAGDVIGQVNDDTVGNPTVIDAQISVGALARSYRLSLPATYDGARPIPLVVLLAGTGGTIDSIEAYTGLPDAALSRGYAVVTPQQAPSADGLPTHWTVPGFPGASDVQFVQSMVTSLEATYCIDPQRIYATGISSGAAFSTYLACQTTMFAAIAPVSGLNLIRKCAGEPEPVLVFHGTSDRIVPYAGVEDVYTVSGVLTNPDSFYNGPIDSSIRDWTERDGCTRTSTARLEPDITVTSFTGCRNESEVVFYSISAGGHTWPGIGDAGTDDQLGHSTTTIRANDVMLDFFDRHIMTS